jgi:hypothetical protein
MCGVNLVQYIKRSFFQMEINENDNIMFYGRSQVMIKSNKKGRNDDDDE